MAESAGKMPVAKMMLSICRCPTHGYWSVSIDDESGGTRLTPSKCCGRWSIVKSWRLSAQEWDRVIAEVRVALMRTRKQERLAEEAGRQR